MFLISIPYTLLLISLVFVISFGLPSKLAPSLGVASVNKLVSAVIVLSVKFVVTKFPPASVRLSICVV